MNEMPSADSNETILRPPSPRATSSPGPMSEQGMSDGEAVTDEDLTTWLAASTPMPWYRRRLTWIVLGAAAMIIAIFAWWLAGRVGAEAPRYSTQTVARGDLVLLITANGTIQPTRSISVGSELSGTVLKVNADVNDRVRKGQVLVELDTAKLRAQILRSQATLAAALAKVAQTTATIREARASLGKLEEVSRLSGGKVPSRAELDTARATLERAVADNASALAGVADAKAALSTDQTTLSKASIVAPADGIVLTRTVDPGNAVAASLQAVTLFTVADDLKKLRLWVYVDEADVGAVAVGQLATFTVSAYLDRSFPARITRVGFGSTITHNVVTYLTYLDVDNADLSLRPGMTATATITATRHDHVLLVPNTALRFTPTAGGPGARGDSRGMPSLLPRMPATETKQASSARAGQAGSRTVWVRAADGKAMPLTVSTGISDGHNTEITSGPLREGMEVITSQLTGEVR